MKRFADLIISGKMTLKQKIAIAACAASLSVAIPYPAYASVPNQVPAAKVSQAAPNESPYNTILFHQNAPYTLVYVSENPLTALSNPETVVADANILNLQNGTYYFEIGANANLAYNPVWSTTGGVIAVSSTYNRGLEVEVVGHGTMVLNWLPKSGPVLRPLNETEDLNSVLRN